MITIRSDWSADISTEDRLIGYTGENKVRREFLLPPGYEDWPLQLDLQLADGSSAVVTLEKAAGGDGDKRVWTITESQLARPAGAGDTMAVQCRAEKAGLVRKSAVMLFTVGPSIEAAPGVPSDPTVIEQVERRMNVPLDGGRQARDDALAAKGEAEGSAALAAAEAARAAGIDAFTKTESDDAFAGALRGEAKGTVAHMEDVSESGALRRAAVLGETKQTVTKQGKNLFDNARASVIGAYPDTTAIGLSSTAKSLYIPCTEGVTYTISRSMLVARFCAYTAESPDVGAETIDNVANHTGLSLTITASAGAKYLLLYYFNSYYDTDVSEEDVRAGIQIERGSAATGYEPFVPDSPSPEYPAPIAGAEPTQLTVSGRNIYDCDAPHTRVSHTTKQADGWWHVSLDNRSGTSNKWATIGSGRIPLPSGTACTLSIEIQNSSCTNGVDFSPTNGSGNPIQFQSWKRIKPVVNGSVDILLLSDEFYHDSPSLSMLPTVTVPPGEQAEFTYRLMLSLGNSALSWEPYTGQIVALPTLLPLYGDGSVNDEYDAVSGVETRRWGRRVFDGTEAWSEYPLEDGYRCKLTNTILSPKYINARAYNAACTHFTVSWYYTDKYFTTLPNGNQLFAINQNGYFILATEPFGSIEGLKAWLAAQYAAGTPVTVLYQLAEPIVTQHDPTRVVPPAPVCNVWSDSTGSMDVGYHMDVTAVIEALERELLVI